LKDNGERLKIFKTLKKNRSKVMKLSDLPALPSSDLDEILTERKQPVAQRIRVKE
jgi:hypothetical protein